MLLIVNMVWCSNYSIAQESNSKNFISSIGLHLGTSSQESFLGNDPDYSHDNKFINIQLTHVVKTSGNWSFELLAQPTYYQTTHQLLNLFYIKPEDFDNFEELRERFLQSNDYEEFTLHLGLQARYNLTDSWSLYAIGAVGPQISTESTERLRQGFTFSDVIGLGTSYRFNKLRWDFRASLRHTSNAQLASPNSGHNSFSIETGVSFLLNE
ncbi:lipid A 3-O-deacylase PagL [Nonlabens dokdonensis]|jgi:hypothetical protein|uniref:PagL domain containing protein n=2 Tax=Nonlabens dokdonensis TaxID=328515 RepID=L7W5B0_NONDD|nr:acyloxyacyl hydrolase [Nonlabens dokdonensis]AGC75352.1 PagL domain containing protein [Nonlabens dokdonensis DSW-6]PZX43056.1 lipid A 3-O-deacylase PagL [Nonlabens dokdonensis]